MRILLCTLCLAALTSVSAAATLTTLTLNADGTISGFAAHDAGTGSPFYTHCNDDPDSSSSDWVGNDLSETSCTTWFALANVDADFTSMTTLQVRVDVQAVGFGNDTCTLTARIYDANNDTTNPLTDETSNLATEADSTRTQRNISFSGLTGTKAQWDAAYIRFTWTYTQNTGPDNASIHLHGCDFDGTYAATPAVEVDFNATDGTNVTIPVAASASSSYEVIIKFRTPDITAATEVPFSGEDAASDGIRMRINVNGSVAWLHNSTTSITPATGFDDNSEHTATASWNGTTVSWDVDASADSDADSSAISTTTNMRLGAKSFASTNEYGGFLTYVKVTQDGTVVFESSFNDSPQIDHVQDIGGADNDARINLASWTLEQFWQGVHAFALPAF